MMRDLKKQEKIKRFKSEKRVNKKSVKLTPRKFLVYDKNCDFCATLAGFCALHLDINIVPNTEAAKIYPFLDKKKIEKDVHYVVIVSRSKMIYSGAEAVNAILGTKIKVLNALYGHPIYRFLFNGAYKIVKKLRKYL